MCGEYLRLTTVTIPFIQFLCCILTLLQFPCNTLSIPSNQFSTIAHPIWLVQYCEIQFYWFSTIPFTNIQFSTVLYNIFSSVPCHILGSEPCHTIPLVVYSTQPIVLGEYCSHTMLLVKFLAMPYLPTPAQPQPTHPSHPDILIRLS